MDFDVNCVRRSVTNQTDSDNSIDNDDDVEPVSRHFIIKPVSSVHSVGIPHEYRIPDFHVVFSLKIHSKHLYAYGIMTESFPFIHFIYFWNSSNSNEPGNPT